MVLKRFSEAGGRGAGGFLGGLFNNPGIVAIGLGLGALVLFRNDIRNFFGTTIPEAIGGIGNIELPDIQFPQITFPSIGDINLPEIRLPDITFPEFNFPNPFKGNESDPRAVPVPDFVGPNFAPGLDEIVVPELGRRDPRRSALIEDVGEPDIQLPSLDPSQNVPLPPLAGNIASIIGRLTSLSPEQFEGLSPQAQESIIERVIDSPNFTGTQEFAVANVGESQAGFQERAAAFVESFPRQTAATSLPGSAILTDAPQFTRESERFEGIQQSEAERAQFIFSNLFGNVQNPDFPITLGEFIGGKSGDIVSPSLFGATDAQIEQFFAEQGF